MGSTTCIIDSININNFVDYYYEQKAIMKLKFRSSTAERFIYLLDEAAPATISSWELYEQCVNIRLLVPGRIHIIAQTAAELLKMSDNEDIYIGIGFDEVDQPGYYLSAPLLRDI